jgi:hypothetical protein
LNSEFLEILSFKILPFSVISENDQKEDLVLKAANIGEFPHTTGTVKFLSEEKQENAGKFWNHQFGFSIPSYISDLSLYQIRNAGAIVIYTDLQILVIYQNDRFQNVPLISEIKSNNDITEIQFSLSSLFAL